MDGLPEGIVVPDPFARAVADVAALFSGMGGLAALPAVVGQSVRDTTETADMDRVQRATDVLHEGEGTKRSTAMFLAAGLLREAFIEDDGDLKALAVLSVLVMARLMADAPPRPDG